VWFDCFVCNCVCVCFVCTVTVMDIYCVYKTYVNICRHSAVKMVCNDNMQATENQMVPQTFDCCIIIITIIILFYFVIIIVIITIIFKVTVISFYCLQCSCLHFTKNKW